MGRLLFLLFGLLLTGRAGVTQDLEPVRNRAFQVKYAVPAHWLVTHQRTDSVEVLRYHSPEDDARLWVGRIRGRYARLPLAQALRQLLRHLGATRHEEHQVSSQGLDLLESTGTCFVQGRELRYDARVTSYQGHLLLVSVYTMPAAFSTHAPLLHRVLESLTPLRGK